MKKPPVLRQMVRPIVQHVAALTERAQILRAAASTTRVIRNRVASTRSGHDEARLG
jgi:hypothetical protein